MCESNHIIDNISLLSFYFRIEDHHVQFRVDPNPQNVDAESMANRLGIYHCNPYLLKYDLFSIDNLNFKYFSFVIENDIELKKRISRNFGVDVAQVAAGNRVSSKLKEVSGM